jgi:UDP-N-acetylglucosamine--N-acetylmuramyl-(pentapeptide) pyrophosphoryl-undecaprenol N-acetylglucosamine transferase
MTEAAPRSVLIMAGGTGGHVFPALAVAACLRNRGINVEWLGTDKGIESWLVPEQDIPIHYIHVAGLRGKGWLSLLKAPMQLCRALYQSFKVLRQLQPICVLGMGGFASGPGGLAAWLSGCPLLIHEQNAVAGTTNKLLARIARKVLLGYPITLGGDKGQHIGNPVRDEIAQLSKSEQPTIASAKKLRLLVLGGSLGAKPVNEMLPQAIARLVPEQQPQIWHQTGAAHIDSVTEAYRCRGLEVKAEAFINDMAAAYSWADLVLCRAGALTVAELTVAAVASILVPLPHAIDDHQTENARWLADNNAGILLPQSSMTVENLSALLVGLNIDRERLASMSTAARALAKTDAAEQLASICLEVASG